MGQHDVRDEVLLQRAGESATRLLQHLSRYAAGGQGEGARPETATVVPAGELESAIMSLRKLVVALHKESSRR